MPCYQYIPNGYSSLYQSNFPQSGYMGKNGMATLPHGGAAALPGTLHAQNQLMNIPSAAGMGIAPSGVIPTSGGMPVAEVTPTIGVVPATGSTLGGAQVAPSMTENPNYTAGFLKTQIGKKVRVEFLIGTGTTTDRVGTLVGVGASYILLLLEETDDVMMGDIYSIKFVTFYR